MHFEILNLMSTVLFREYVPLIRSVISFHELSFENGEMKTLLFPSSKFSLFIDCNFVPFPEPAQKKFRTIINCFSYYSDDICSEIPQVGNLLTKIN